MEPNRGGYGEPWVRGSLRRLGGLDSPGKALFTLRACGKRKELVHVPVCAVGARRGSLHDSLRRSVARLMRVSALPT